MSRIDKTHQEQGVRLFQRDPALAHHEVVGVSRLLAVPQLEAQRLAEKLAEGAARSHREELVLRPAERQVLVLRVSGVSQSHPLLRVDLRQLVGHGGDARVRAVIDVLAVVLRPRHHHAPQVAVVQVQHVAELEVDHRLHETQAPHRLLLDGAIEADASVRVVSS